MTERKNINATLSALVPLVCTAHLTQHHQQNPARQQHANEYGIHGIENKTQQRTSHQPTCASWESARPSSLHSSGHSPPPSPTSAPVLSAPPEPSATLVSDKGPPRPACWDNTRPSNSCTSRPPGSGTVLLSAEVSLALPPPKCPSDC